MTTAADNPDTPVEADDTRDKPATVEAPKPVEPEPRRYYVPNRHDRRAARARARRKGRP